jgi:hypothetical protein
VPTSSCGGKSDRTSSIWESTTIGCSRPIRYAGLPFQCRNTVRQGLQLRGLIVQKTILILDQLPQSSDFFGHFALNKNSWR